MFMVALAFVTRYSGMDTVLGLSLTRTGRAYAFFGTLLGWLGVALTGTDAGSNALFGNLQRVTAERLGLSPILMAAANSSGGVMGKMIDAQSIVIATSATGQVGREAALFKAVLWHSLVLVCLVGLIVVAYAFFLPELGSRLKSPDAPIRCFRNRSTSCRSIRIRWSAAAMLKPWPACFCRVARIRTGPGSIACRWRTATNSFCTTIVRRIGGRAGAR